LNIEYILSIGDFPELWAWWAGYGGSSSLRLKLLHFTYSHFGVLVMLWKVLYKVVL
jgi:hypothetical protein